MAVRECRTQPAVAGAQLQSPPHLWVPGRHIERVDTTLREQPVQTSRTYPWAWTEPSCTSASNEVTVSMASDLLVPITPVGPRLIHPVTYSSGENPPSRITRPSACGTRPVRSSKGILANGRPR